MKLTYQQVQKVVEALTRVPNEGYSQRVADDGVDVEGLVRELARQPYALPPEVIRFAIEYELGLPSVAE